MPEEFPSDSSMEEQAEIQEEVLLDDPEKIVLELGYADMCR